MSQNLLRLMGWVSLLVVLLVGFSLYQFFSGSTTLRGTRLELRGDPLAIAVRTGDFQKAASDNLAIQNNAVKSSEEKAVATYSTLGVQYRLTAETSARLLDVQKMKKIILDQTVSLRTRVNTLNVLSTQYSISGRDPAVFTEIYKDEPFSTYLAPGDPDLSARRLAEWSYGLMPTSNAGISIARWYTEQYVLNPDQDLKTTSTYADIAEDYLRKADAATVQEAKDDPSFSRSSTRYLVYRYWRTVVIGRLAAQKGEPYQSQYRSAYGDFISFAMSQQNVLAKEFLMYARLFFAQRLAQNNDDAGARGHLDQLAEDLNKAQNTNTNVFIRFLRTEHERPTGATWNLVKSMFTISPDFKTAVEKIVGSDTISN